MDELVIVFQEKEPRIESSRVSKWSLAMANKSFLLQLDIGATRKKRRGTSNCSFGWSVLLVCSDDFNCGEEGKIKGKRGLWVGKSEIYFNRRATVRSLPIMITRVPCGWWMVDGQLLMSAITSRIMHAFYLYESRHMSMDRRVNKVPSFDKAKYPNHWERGSGIQAFDNLLSCN